MAWSAAKNWLRGRMPSLLGLPHGAARAAAFCVLILALNGCSRELVRGDGEAPGAKPQPSVAAKAQSPEPGVVTAADSVTLHMEVPQPEIVVDPDAESAPPAPQGPGLEAVMGADVLAKVKALGGRGTLVNVWASWCGACKAEMPMLLALEQRYRDKGIQVLFVSVDEAGATEKLLSAANERGLPKPWLVAKGSLGYFKLALSPIWQGSMPATFLYDASGKLRYFWGTQAYEKEITAILDGFLAGQKIDGVANVSVMSAPR
jgi:thiol-disulfide isomerase/thioredoxin